MKEYEINDETLAILPRDVYEAMVIEDSCSYEVSMTPLEIINYSCKYFGSSYEGRKVGATNILKSKYKLPIIIEDTRNIIFFPTRGASEADCIWIALNSIKDYKKIKDNKTELTFINGKKIDLDISFAIFSNQVLRASRLESIIRKRKEKAN